MDYSSLATTASLMTAKEPSDLKGYSNAEVIALKQTQAKEDMKWDLEEAIGYEYDAAGFTDYLDENEAYLQEALACKQLYWFYLEQNAGDGSSANIKMKHYEKLYNQKSARFSGLKANENPYIETARLTR